MNRKLVWWLSGILGACVAAMIAVALVGGIAFTAVSASGGAGGAIVAAVGKGSANGQCTVTVPVGGPGSTPAEGSYDADQISIIRTIIGIGKTAGVPEKGWVIALIVAFQESGIRNLDHGDRDSLGVYQQRPSTGWGTKEQIMDVVYATQAFYLGVNGNGNPGLMSVPNWETLEPTVAAQKVQRSGFPDAYAPHEPKAVLLVEKYRDSPAVPLTTNGAVNHSPGNSNNAGGSTCGSNGTPGSINAAGDDYPGRNWVPDNGSVAGGLARECVDFTAWRMRKLTPGFNPADPYYGTWYALGNGAQWGPAAAAAGYKVDRNPKAGDIAYWNNSFYGHVAFVTAVNDNGTISLEEYNWALPGGGSDYSFHTRTISSGEPAGYIHFLDDPKHPMVPNGRSQMGSIIGNS